MAKPLSKTVVVAYGRSAVAKSGKKGALRNLHPIDMGGLVLKERDGENPQLDPALVEDVILGCAIPEAKQGLNPARLVAAPVAPCLHRLRPYRGPLLFIPLSRPGLAAWRIEAGQADCIVAGGIESMTALPMTLDRSGDVDPWLLERPRQYISNGETARTWRRSTASPGRRWTAWLWRATEGGPPPRTRGILTSRSSPCPARGRRGQRDRL